MDFNRLWYSCIAPMKTNIGHKSLPPITISCSSPKMNMVYEDCAYSTVDDLLHTQVSGSTNDSWLIRPLSSSIASLATTFIHQGVAHWAQNWTLSHFPLAYHKFQITSTLGLLLWSPPTVHKIPSPFCSICT